jgi:nucleotide-binding universal stress UspA family protein
VQILICYDGSADAQAALEAAGRLFAGKPAIILTVWEGLSQVMARTGAALAPMDYEAADRASAKAAQERAEAGCSAARLAGLDAHPRTVRQHLSVGETILDEAEAVGADVIVLGSRGLTGVKSLLLGSVSHAVLQHADRPVVVVPSLPVAERRHERRHERQAEDAGQRP